MLEVILRWWSAVVAEPGLAVVVLVFLVIASTTVAGVYLIAVDPLVGQMRWRWRQWRQRRADARVLRERMERIRLDAALHAPMNGTPRPWPPRRAGEHSQEWRERQRGDVA